MNSRVVAVRFEIRRFFKYSGIAWNSFAKGCAGGWWAAEV
jgi:hypothetical protein